MTQLMLNAEQTKIIAKSLEPIQVCSPTGEVLGVIQPEISREEIARLKQVAKSDGPWYTTEQVLQHLGTLESQ